MAPRKTNTTAAASQDSLDEHVLRSGRKRRLSEASQSTTSFRHDQHESSSMASPTARKRLRVDEQAQKAQQAGGKGKGRAQSRLTGELENGDEGEDELAASSQLIKMPIKRRKTISPRNAAIQQLQKQRSLMTPEASNEDIRESLQYTPLREMINDRKRQKRDSTMDNETRAAWIELAKKEDRVRALENLLDGADQFSAAELMQYEAEKQSLEVELAAVVRPYRGGDLLVLDSRQSLDLALATSPSPADDHAADLELSRSQVARRANEWDIERTKLQDSVLALSKQVAEAKEEWHLHEIALQSLDFTAEDAPGAEVIDAIRHAFTTLRAELGGLIHDTDLEQMTNGDLLDYMAQELYRLSEQAAALDAQIEQRNKLVYELQEQVGAVMERLADAELEIERMSKQRTELLGHAESSDTSVQDLQLQIDALNEEGESLSSQLAELQGQRNQLQRTVDRHKETIKHYRGEEQRLSDIISRMEVDHNTRITAMTKEREDAVRGLADEVDAAIDARGVLEAQIENLNDDLTKLQKEATDAATERTSLFGKLQKLDQDVQAEQELRQQAEAAVQARTSEVDDLNLRVENLEQDIEDLRAGAQQLREINEQEQHERVLAEEDAEEHKRKYEEADAASKKLGIDANEVRMKLFELQQKHAAELESVDAQLADQMQQAGKAEKAAVSKRAELEGAVQTLRATLASHEDRIKNLGQAANEDAEAHEQELKARNEEIDALKSTAASYEEALSDLEQQKADLELVVQTEADRMIEVEKAHEVALDAIRAKLEEQYEKMLNVEQAAKQADDSWQALLTSRTDELDHERRTASLYRDANDDLRREKQQLERRLASYVRTARFRMREVTEAIQAAGQTALQEAADLEAEGQTELAALGEQIDVMAVRRSLSAKTRRRGRRNNDSAIGLASDELEPDPIAM